MGAKRDENRGLYMQGWQWGAAGHSLDAGVLADVFLPKPFARGYEAGAEARRQALILAAICSECGKDHSEFSDVRGL